MDIFGNYIFTTQFKTTATFIGFLALVGCGGEGGGVEVAAPYDYTLGTPSSEQAAEASLFGDASGLPYTAPNNEQYTSVSEANAVLNNGGDPIATVDTSARTAWQDGWTGKGVKVGVADLFNGNGEVDVHGDYVSIVVLSVAPESELALADILSGGTLETLFADVEAAYDFFESNGYHIINNSWGIERPIKDSTGAYTGQLISDFDAVVDDVVANWVPPSDSNEIGLYVFAAGNGGQFCGSRRIEDCNLYAAITDGLRDAGYEGGERLIFVGALEDGSDQIASYSYYAGDLKDDFIVAHDDILTYGDGAGTSFAAPRVTGAAALVRQKFPNLTSEQVKQVLLQTATDLGAPGVDSIYGHGELNVPGTLSPYGVVVPR